VRSTMKLLRRLLSLLYEKLDRSFTALRFDRLYRLCHDPYSVLNLPYELRKQDVILQFVSKKLHTNVLDIGCGTGIITKRLAPYCQHILGVDFSSKAISIAKMYCKDCDNISFVVTDIRKFEDTKKYDLFVCSEVLYYLNTQDLDIITQKIAKMATPTAWLLIVGRADDIYVIPMLHKNFALLDRVEEPNCHRPFAVSLFDLGGF